ncbi:hypothetical protein GAI80_20720 [Escherichia coli]|nr:hypothetical protein [Escherichia coli]
MATNVQVRSRSSTFVRSEKPNLRSTSVRNIPQDPLIINGDRPHESLNNMTPEEYQQHHYLAGISKMPETKTGLLHYQCTLS